MKSFFSKPALQAFTLLLGVLITARSGMATTAVMVTDADLTASSRVILIGDVKSVKAQRDPRDQTIYTYVKVQVSELLKGQLQGGTIVFKQLGGTVGDETAIIYGAPEYKAGQRVLLFLDTKYDGTLRVAHFFQGKYDVVKDAQTGREQVVRKVDKNAVHLLGTSESSEITNQDTLTGFTTRINRALVERASLSAEYDVKYESVPVVETPPEYVDEPADTVGAGDVSAQYTFFSPGMRWFEPDSGQPVTYRVNSAGAPTASGGVTEINQAFAAWSGVQTTALVMQNIGSTTSSGWKQDGVSALSFNDPFDQISDPVGCSGTLAIGGPVNAGGASKVIGGLSFMRINEGDVVFNNGFDCFLSNSMNLAAVACHELGHTLGFDHSPDTAAIMYASVSGGRGAVLGNDDIGAVSFLYPGSKTAPPPPPPPPPTGAKTPFDFDADGRADLSVYRPASGTWFISKSGGATSTALWGSPAQNDVPVPGDYDGDGRTDVAVWRTSTGVWYIINSSNGATRSVSWGNGNIGFNDVPVPGDYDGDGKTDIAVWRTSTGAWYIINSSTGATRVASWGTSSAPFNDVAVPADYDGDGRCDIAVWRTSTGVWYIINSSNGATTTRGWGSGTTDVPVPADYDGDKKADIAVWRKSSGQWWIINSSDGSTASRGWGSGATDVAVPADYDGDGKADVAVWRSTTGVWWIVNSSNGSTRSGSWGVAGDVAVPSVYINR